MLAAERPAVDLNDAAELTQTEADLPLLGEHDMDDLQCRILTSGTSGEPRPVGLTYGNFLFSAVGSAFNLGVDPSDRWLCCLPLSHVAGLSIILRSVIYGTTAVLLDGFDTEQVAEHARLGRHLAALARADPADPAARGGRGPLGAARDPDRRRAGPAGRPPGGARPGRDRGPDLRHDRDLLPGDDARARGRGAQGRLRRAPAAHHATSASRTARSWSRARPSLPAATTRTAGCTPATSATSTRRASSRSRAAAAR